MRRVVTKLSYVGNVASEILAREEELELARRVRDLEDKEAANMLVRSQLRMVVSLAMKFRHYGVPVSDLIGEGNCGLTIALFRFDPERGVRFGTYAKHWVRAHIIACVVRSLNIVGGSSGLLKTQDFFRLRRERARVAALHGEGDAADQALAARMNIGLERLRGLLGRLDSKSFSLNVASLPELMDHCVDLDAVAATPEESYCHEQRHEIVRAAVTRALAGLDARERFIAEHRLMASPADELSLAEMGERMGISRERARQLEARTKEKLKRSPAIRKNSLINEWFAGG